MRASGDKDWERFEVAVATFVDALGTGAKVVHDVKTPDRHTGHPRQRDVWVEWVLGGIFPVRALISCKYWDSVLDQQDIDHFNGEFQSANAHVGVIYARRGFNDNAIEKARVLGFSCCRLFGDEPTDIPQALKFGMSYFFKPQIGFKVDGAWPLYGFQRWADVFALPYEGRTLLDELVDHLHDYQRIDDPAARWRSSCEGRAAVAVLKKPDLPLIQVTMFMRDRSYRGKIEYTLLNGSYNVTSGHFVGQQSSPWLAINGDGPGPGWEEVTLPEQRPDKGLFMYASGNERGIIEDFGQTEFPKPTPTPG